MKNPGQSPELTDQQHRLRSALEASFGPTPVDHYLKTALIDCFTSEFTPPEEGPSLGFTIAYSHHILSLALAAQANPRTLATLNTSDRRLIAAILGKIPKTTNTAYATATESSVPGQSDPSRTSILSPDDPNSPDNTTKNPVKKRLSF